MEISSTTVNSSSIFSLLPIYFILTCSVARFIIKHQLNFLSEKNVHLAKERLHFRSKNMYHLSLKHLRDRNNIKNFFFTKCAPKRNLFMYNYNIQNVRLKGEGILRLFNSCLIHGLISVTGYSLVHFP